MTSKMTVLFTPYFFKPNVSSAKLVLTMRQMAH